MKRTSAVRRSRGPGSREPPVRRGRPYCSSRHSPRDYRPRSTSIATRPTSRGRPAVPESILPSAEGAPRVRRQSNAPALEQPGQVGRCGHIVGETELRPPAWHARIGDEGAVAEIEDAVCRQCHHDQPERRPEARSRDGKEDRASQRLEHERLGGVSHDCKERIVGRDDDRHDGIEGAVAIQASRWQQPHANASNAPITNATPLPPWPSCSRRLSRTRSARDPDGACGRNTSGTSRSIAIGRLGAPIVVAGAAPALYPEASAACAPRRVVCGRSLSGEREQEREDDNDERRPRGVDGHVVVCHVRGSRRIRALSGNGRTGPRTTPD